MNVLGMIDWLNWLTATIERGSEFIVDLLHSIGETIFDYIIIL